MPPSVTASAGLGRLFGIGAALGLDIAGVHSLQLIDPAEKLAPFIRQRHDIARPDVGSCSNNSQGFLATGFSGRVGFHESTGRIGK